MYQSRGWLGGSQFEYEPFQEKQTLTQSIGTDKSEQQCRSRSDATDLLRRQFAWNVKPVFWEKIRKIFQTVICWNFNPGCRALSPNKKKNNLILIHHFICPNCPCIHIFFNGIFLTLEKTWQWSCLICLRIIFNQIAIQTTNVWYSYVFAKKHANLWSVYIVWDWTLNSISETFWKGTTILLCQKNQKCPRMYPTKN